MKKLCLALLAMLLIVGGACGAEASPADEFTILSFAPGGMVKGRMPVKVVFSQPVVERDAVGKTVSRQNMPVEFSPDIRGAGKWTDQKTFVFTPVANLQQATLYRATAKESLRDLKNRRLAGKQDFEFHTEPLKLLKAQQTDFTENNNVVIELTFNLPVSPFRMRGFLSILNEQKQQMNYFPMGQAPASVLRISTNAYDGRRLTILLAPGLTSDAGPLGVEKEFRQEISVTRKMEIRSVYADTRYPATSIINVNTSVGADMSVVSRFLELSPKMPFTVEPGYNGFTILGDFKPRRRVELTIRKGLPSRDGHKLERDFSRAVIFPDLYPSLSFPSGGTFLSPAGDLRIPIESVNIEEISLNLWRVYENNIPVSMLSSYSIPRDLARRVATRTARPEGRLNEPVRRAIDLRELAGESKGVFLLTASESSGEYWADAEQLVAVTDLGIVARVWPNGITVWVNTILGIRPVNGAVVRVYSRSNQMVASGKTDGDGLWTWHGKDPWDSQLTPSIVTVEKDDDISFLKLEGNLLADAGFDIGGRPRSEKYDALLFAPRGVFRPGEKVDFSALVRTKDLLPPEPFPVVYVVRSSLGREVTRGTALLSPEGIASFSARLAPASPTGMYSAIVSLPGGESTPLGRTEFFVEDFVAPRLEVKATSDSTFLEEGETLTIDIASSYLFGAPAAGLPFEGEVRAVAVPFRPEGWSAFTFGDPERSFETVTDYIGNGTLDEEGKGELEFSGPEGWLPPASIDLSFFVKVMEESGRWVPAALRIPFHPYPVYLGIEMPKGDQVPGREIRTRIAAVTPEGKPSELEMAVAEVYMVKHHYNLVRMGNQTRMQVQRELVPHSDGTVKFTDGIGSFAFTPKGQGEFVLRISDETSNSMASASMMVWTPYWSGEGEGSTLLDRVVVTPDKEKYEPGDKATLSLRSPFEGNLLVTVETDKELLRKVVPLNKGEVTLQIPVTEAMIPNAYVSASVIRPVVEGQEWGNHRAIGTISIPVERKEHRLSVAILSPERTLPDEPLSVNGTLTDGTGTPRKGEVVLFLVDEGILSLTGYKTPDPWAFFMAKRAQGISVYDLYDQLLPLESRETPLLRAGGGAGEEAMAALRAGMSPVSARTFRMLSIFLGSVATDENGSFEATFDVPEFSGKGRLMAVASAGSAFGKGETFVRIARDVTTELSLPRAVSPGDAFHAPLKLFSGASEKTRVSVKVSIDGPLSFSGKKEFLADLVPGAEALFSVPFTAGPQAGTAFLSVETEWEDGAFTQELDLPVRPAFPRVALSGSGVVRGDAPGTIEIPREWFPGTEEGKLLLADLPALDLLGAATFLLQYPYGCLEQTVSGAWPLLALGELVRDIDPRLVNEEERAAALALKIRQISAMQLYTGGFANWPGSSIPSQWGSLYATHFLVEAKKSGAPVPDDLLEIALSNVRSMLPLAPLNDSDSAFRSNMTLKAYAAYILSLRGEPPLGWMAHLGEHKDSLYGSGTVFLAGAHALASGTPDSLRQLGTGAPSLRGGGAETFESVSRNTALKLLMWTEVDPLSAPAAELAFRLLEEARRNTWRTTQDNAMAVLALGRWMEKTREARKPFTAVLKDASGNEIASFSDGKRLSLDLGELPKGAMTLTLSGNGTAYFAWTSAGVPLKEPAPFSSGIAVKRAWTNREGKPVQEGTPVSRGERITVTLILTPSAPLRDLVVVDMLPGGMEIENTRLSGEGDSPDRSGIRAELRDDRLILFVDSLTNSVEYKYLIRAVSRGVFTLPPVAAEGMYAPDTASVGVPGKVEIY